MTASDVRWAPRVDPALIRRLYEADARGIVDDELIAEAGFALYARCLSIVRVTDAHEGGRVACPRCERVTRAAIHPTVSVDRDALIVCAGCGWSVSWRDYMATYQHKHLVGGGAIEFHRAFVERYPEARTPRERLLEIDRLIHAFHWELKSAPGRSAARELIYARNTTELLTFLDRLTYGGGSTPELRAGKAEWDRKLDSSGWHRMMGYRPES